MNIVDRYFETFERYVKCESRYEDMKAIDILMIASWAIIIVPIGYYMGNKKQGQLPQIGK